MNPREIERAACGVPREECQRIQSKRRAKQAKAARKRDAQKRMRAMQHVGLLPNSPHTGAPSPAVSPYGKAVSDIADGVKRAIRRRLALTRHICPACGANTFDHAWRDQESEKENRISGLCQKCQDEFFGKP